MRVFVAVAAVIIAAACPVAVSANWGVKVGRAGPDDVIRLARDWAEFVKYDTRLRTDMRDLTAFERQRQLLGEELQPGMSPQELFQAAQQLWIRDVLGPLQKIALNPAASCAEAQYAFGEMVKMQRQEQLVGLERDPQVQLFHETTERMAAHRCKDEALDECNATGRFMQILDLLTASDRQSQLLGRDEDLEAWADDALKQCAIYELHFVSKTSGGHGPVKLETVRDGKVKIRYETPPGGLSNHIKARGRLEEMLKGETSGGNNPFFVSVTCTSPMPGMVSVTCSPGADSTPIKVGIHELDLRHPEFYVESERLRNPQAYPREKVIVLDQMVSKQRLVGEDKLAFEFEGGMFSLEGLIKAPYNTVSMPFPDWGNTFYMAHKKDAIGGERSGKVLVKGNKRGVEPAIFDFPYADQNQFGDALTIDATDFELLHKPEPKPFPNYNGPDPIRKPLRPRPN